MNACKHCKWWRVSVGEKEQIDLGQCMYYPPKIFCHYDDETDDAAMIYDRPQTYDYDFCSRFENRSQE